MNKEDSLLGVSPCASRDGRPDVLVLTARAACGTRRVLVNYWPRLKQSSAYPLSRSSRRPLVALLHRATYLAKLPNTAGRGLGSGVAREFRQADDGLSFLPP